MPTSTRLHRRKSTKRRHSAQEQAQPESSHALALQRVEGGAHSEHDVLHLQRTVGNKATIGLLNRAPETSHIQREPLIYNPSKQRETDAASWSLKDIQTWERWYNGKSDNLKRQFKDDFDKVQQLKTTDKIQEELNFDEKKQVFQRDPRKVARANGIVAQFGTIQPDPQNPWAFTFDQAHVMEELFELVNDPAKMDQKQYPVCGADTYLRMFAVYHPEAYVKYVVDLLTTGVGTLGNQTIRAPREVKQKQLFAQKMQISSWVGTASLRSSKNKLFKKIVQSGKGLKEYTAGLAGMTGPGEMKKWFREAGLPREAIVDKSFITSNIRSHDLVSINEKFGNGWAVGLSINANIVENELDKAIKPALTYHFVTLASNIRLTSDGRNYMADVLTWGEKKRIRFKQSQLGRAIIGYTAADISKLPQPENNAPGGQNG